jgi:hypothetical protein
MKMTTKWDTRLHCLLYTCSIWECFWKCKIVDGDYILKSILFYFMVHIVIPSTRNIMVETGLKHEPCDAFASKYMRRCQVDCVYCLGTITWYILHMTFKEVFICCRITTTCYWWRRITPTYEGLTGVGARERAPGAGSTGPGSREYSKVKGGGSKYPLCNTLK